MKSTFTILFYLKKGKISKDGKATIMVRVTIEGQETAFSTKQKCKPAMWDQDKQKVKGNNNPDMQLINEALTQLEHRIRKEYNNLYDEHGFVEPLMIKDKLNDDTSRIKTLGYWSEKFLSSYKTKIGIDTSQKTYSRYLLTQKRLFEFIKYYYGKEDVYVKDLKTIFIEDFYYFLVSTFELCNNTALESIKRFHTFLIYAKKSGEQFTDPFDNFKFRFDKVDRGYLDIEEVQTIMNQEFTTYKSRLEKVRDMFIFSCFTGLSYIDLYELTPDDIKPGFDGSDWIRVKREKTGVQSDIKLLDIPRMILNKYKGTGKNGKLLPIISNQKMNEYLGMIQTICGIEKRITFHLARHTFATLSLTVGVPIESVSKMLGHTDIKTTQIYAKVIPRKLSSDMNILADKLQQLNFGTIKIGAVG